MHERVEREINEALGVTRKEAAESFISLVRSFVKDAQERDVIEQIRASTIERALHSFDSSLSVSWDDWLLAFPYLIPAQRSNHDLSAGYMFTRLWQTGDVIYKLSPNLSRALSHTSFRLTFGDIKWPSRTGIVYFGKGNGIVAGSGEPLEYLFFDCVHLAGSVHQLRMVLGYTDSDGDPANRSLGVFTFNDHTVLDSDALHKEIEEERVSVLSMTPVDPSDKVFAHIQYQLAFNFLLYVSNIDDSSSVYPSDAVNRLTRLKNPKKLRRAEKACRDETRYRFTYVGAKYDSRLSGVLPTRPGAKLDHKTIVTGHWRKQWYGPRKDLDGNPRPGAYQEILWIEPFVKGAGSDDKKTVRVVR